MSGKVFEPIPNNYDNPTLKKMFMAIQNIFKNLTGAWLKDGTVTYAKLGLSAKDIPTVKINWPEWVVPLSLPAADATTVSSAYVRCSGIFKWDPGIYPTSGGSWYFEASLAIGAAADTVTAQLMGAAEVGVVSHTGDTVLTLKRSAALTMPTSAANFSVNFKTSNTATTAYFAGARLVFVPS